MGDPAPGEEPLYKPNRGPRRSRFRISWVWFVGNEKRVLRQYIEGERPPLPAQDRPRVRLTPEAQFRLDALPETFREFQSMASQSTSAAAAAVRLELVRSPVAVSAPGGTLSVAVDENFDVTLDGEVADAVEMIQKLAESDRAEQVFVRHAFRFWMGRNETLNDAPVLQEARRAYKDGGGSMKALLVSLLTSDAFLYRKRIEPALDEAN